MTGREAKEPRNPSQKHPVFIPLSVFLIIILIIHLSAGMISDTMRSSQPDVIFGLFSFCTPFLNRHERSESTDAR